MRNDRNSRPPAKPSKIVHRRKFVTGSLAAGAGVAVGATSWKAWSQFAPPTPVPTIPIECVPPVPFGQAASFGTSGGPVRVRKSVFELDANEVSRLKSAYAELLKITKNNDPRGWYRQGAVHCWYCTGAIDALNGMEIHGGWWFLAWHRCYLYFHERILGALIGDPTFALPYWDWDSCTDDPNDKTGRNRFPGEVYGFPTDNPNIFNPLFDTTRAVNKDDRIPPVYVGPTRMKRILGSSSFTDFGGSGNQELPVFAQNSPQQAGSLEAGPHGLVHLWTTDPTNFSGLADMGMLAAAAFDPVFFAHHANIDRLWSVWAGTTGHANPSNDRWLTQPFYFYDQAQNWIGIVIDQVLDSEQSLAYRYQPPHWPPTPAGPAAVAAAPAPSGAMRVAQVEPLGAPLATLDTGVQPKPLPPQATTLQLAVPREAKPRMTALATAPTQNLVLRIDGVELPADRGVVVQVFVNRPDVTAPVQGPTQGHVGDLVIVPSTAPRTMGPRQMVTRNFGFPLSPEQAAGLADKDNIAVTLVPVTGNQRPGEVLRYRSVYLSSR